MDSPDEIDSPIHKVGHAQDRQMGRRRVRHEHQSVDIGIVDVGVGEGVARILVNRHLG